MAARKKKGAEPPQEVEFRYSRSPGYRLHPADGAWGGLTPGGDVMVCFYVEHFPTPSTVRQPVNEDGTLGKEVFREPPREPGVITRELQTGVVLTLDEAERLAQWLAGRVKQRQALQRGAADE